MEIGHPAATTTTQFAMGTVMTHKAFGPSAEEGLARACAEITRIENHLSRFLPGSDIYRINASAGQCPQQVSPETFEVLSQAAQLARSCPGCFDVTIEPVVRLWSQARETLETPEKISLRRALGLVNAADLILDAWEMTAALRYAGQAIDLGGIGKGYAGDRILEIYRAAGITSAYANLGGNVITLGARPDGSPWQIGIQHPRQPEGLIGAVAVENQTVVTSGDYQRFYTDRQGIRHHHILDPNTGYPAQVGLLSVSIIAEKSAMADGLSTAVFIAGPVKGLEYLRRFPQTEAILVEADLRVSITPGLRDRFQAAQGIDIVVLK